MLPTPRRSIAGISITGVVIAIAVLFVLRRVPPHTPERSSGSDEAALRAGHGAQDEAGQTATQTSVGSANSSSAGIMRISLEAFSTKASVVSQMPDSEARLEALSSLMKEWAELDPIAASQWVADLPNDHFRTDAAGELVSVWGKVDPKKAGLWLTVSGLADGETMSTLAGTWATQDPAAAAQWSTALSDATLRHAAINAVAMQWTALDSALASTWVETLPEADRLMTAAHVVSVWARKDPESAATWIMRLTPDDPDAMAGAASALIHVWTEQDAGAVSRWLNGLPVGELREATVTVFAGAAAATEPADAILWATSLTSSEHRNETVAEVCGTWYDAQPVNFRDNIASQLDAMPDAMMRRAVYEMLYEKDREFHDSLLSLAEVDPTKATP